MISIVVKERNVVWYLYFLVIRYGFENERTTEGEAYLLYSINLDTIEVIGNIYENKELLNETD